MIYENKYSINRDFINVSYISRIVSNANPSYDYFTIHIYFVGEKDCVNWNFKTKEKRDEVLNDILTLCKCNISSQQYFSGSFHL